MKAVTTLIRIALIFLWLILFIILLVSPNIYTSGIVMFGFGVITIIWWVTISLNKQVDPREYLPKVAIFSGVLLSSISLFHFMAAYYGHLVNLTLAQVAGGFLGGFLIIRLGLKHQILSK